MSYDNRRTFILNQGSGTVSVIDSQQNQIDTSANLIANQPGVPAGQIAVGQNPVWATFTTPDRFLRWPMQVPTR